MIMVADSLPGLRSGWLPLGLKDDTKLLVIRVIVACFLLHTGRMSCLRAEGGAVRCEARHRAQIQPLPARPRWRNLDINVILRRALLDAKWLTGLLSSSSTPP